MLRVILGILKITGILLLAVLLLILAVLLAILFVPVRYRLSAVHTETETKGEVRVTWLLKLLSVRLAYDMAQKEKLLQIRIIGIPFESITRFFGKIEKAAGRKKKRRADRKKDRKQPENQPEMPELPDGEAPEPEVSELPDGEASEPGTAEPEVLESEIAEPDESEPEIPEPERSPGDMDVSETHESAMPDEPGDKTQLGKPQPEGKSQDKRAAKRRPFYRRIPEKFQKLLYKFRSFCDTIKRIPGRLRRLLRRLRSLLEKPGRLMEKLSSYRHMFEAYAVAEVLQNVRREFRRLLRHYAPRKGTGYLRFGTGDPALTGELTGLLYLLLPVSFGEVRIEPEFTETLLATELELKGHIRFIHLAGSAWRLFRDKKFRRFIKHFLLKSE